MAVTLTRRTKCNYPPKREGHSAQKIVALNGMLNLRVEKTVRVLSVRLGLYGSLYNVTNRVVVARVNNTSGSAFGQPRAYSAPREFRAGVRMTF